MIRQIVHYLALSSSLSLMPIETSLALIKAIQGHVTQLLLHAPDSWDNFIVRKFSASAEDEGYKPTLREMITLQIEHTIGHLDEIREMRRVRRG